MNHRNELLALKRSLTEKHDEEQAEARRRIIWMNKVLAAWDDQKYPTLGEFMASPEGQQFRGAGKEKPE